MIQRIGEAMPCLFSTTTKLDTATQSKRRKKYIYLEDWVEQLQLDWGKCNAISTQITKELKKKPKSQATEKASLLRVGLKSGCLVAPFFEISVALLCALYRHVPIGSGYQHQWIFRLFWF